MAQQKFCQDCNQRHNCQEVYRQLGNTKSPSVVLKVVIALLLPLMVFIGSLAAFESVLAKTIDGNNVQTALSFLLALAVSFIFVLSSSLLAARGGSK